MDDVGNFKIDTHSLRDVIILLCNTGFDNLDKSISSIISKIGQFSMHGATLGPPSNNCPHQVFVITTHQKIHFTFNISEQKVLITYGNRIIFRDDEWFSEPIDKRIKLLVGLIIEKLNSEYDRIVSLQLEELMNIEKTEALATIRNSEVSTKQMLESYSLHNRRKFIQYFLFITSFIGAGALTLAHPLLISMFAFPIFYTFRIREENKILKQIESAQQGETDKQMLAIERIIQDDEN